MAAAAAVELLHSASLVHDDLLDDADTRRGVVAIHRREGMSSAVIAGDALIAMSWRTIAAADPANSADLAAALLAMCDGQAQEESLRFRQDSNISDVVRVAALKTGALLESACRIGARVGGCTERQVDLLGVFGRDLGVELQILDDVLDLVSDDTTLGKPTGGDFRAGVLTLPTVFGLVAPSHFSNRMRELFVPEVSLAAAREARSIVLDSGAVARAVAAARDCAQRAAQAADDADAGALAALPGHYLQLQLLKVAADCRVRVSAAPMGSGHHASAHPSDAWEGERAV